MSLLHRPVSRGTLFRGKVVGGLILYALATVPPFLFSVWLVATPGYFGAPFVPDMTLAGAADLCAGAAYYFAALALGTAGWSATLQPDRLGPPWIGKLVWLVVFYGMCGLGDLARTLFDAVGPARHSRVVNDYLSELGLPVRCPFCDHRRALSGDECPHCRRRWEEPAATGAEIFQPQSARG